MKRILTVVVSIWRLRGGFSYLINKWFLFDSLMSDLESNAGLGKTNMVFAFPELSVSSEAQK